MYKRDRERRRSRESRETGREGDICSTREKNGVGEEEREIQGEKKK